MSTDHLKGHENLADMVQTHVQVWRELLEKARDAAPQHDNDIGGVGADYSFFEHELKALADIQEACKIELDLAAPSHGLS